MKLTRRSALKKMATVIGSTTLLGFTNSPVKVDDHLGKASKQADYNVCDYGAKGDGRANDTAAINKAITTAAQARGGRVLFPAGTFRTGSIHLKSNVSLYIGLGAVIEATHEAYAYDPAEPFKGRKYQDFGHSHWHNSLIWGEGLQNIVIEGPGVIYGKGLLRDEAEHPSQKGLANKTIALKKCQNITLKDFTIKHGGWFGVLATGVDNFTIDNLTIDTNRDGIDIDACRNVRISNCSVNSPRDDAIVPKSSYALGYARATRGMVITNCIVSGYKEGTLLDGTFKTNAKRNPPIGRIKFGTESNGGFKNITISNCVFEHCRGLALETVDGGYLEDVSISNITMRDVGNAPIFLRLGRRMRGPKGTPVGKLQRVNISNVVVHNAAKKTGVLISGIPGHPIEDVKISNLQIQYEGGGTKREASINPPEKEDSYPNPDRFGTMPSYGIYLRHIKGIEVINAKLTYMNKEVRPPFALKDVTEADFRFVKAQHHENSPVFFLENVTKLRIFETDSLTNKKIDHVKQRKI